MADASDTDRGISTSPWSRTDGPRILLVGMLMDWIGVSSMRPPKAGTSLGSEWEFPLGKSSKFNLQCSNKRERGNIKRLTFGRYISICRRIFEIISQTNSQVNYLCICDVELRMCISCNFVDLSTKLVYVYKTFTRLWRICVPWLPSRYESIGSLLITTLPTSR